MKGNTGADNQGSYYAQNTEQLHSGDSNLYVANFQVYNEPNSDPSICEVYAVIGKEVWQSYIIYLSLQDSLESYELKSLQSIRSFIIFLFNSPLFYFCL